MTPPQSHRGCLLGLLDTLLAKPRRLSEREERLPYRSVHSLLTPAEASFYHTLRQAIPEGVVVLPKVRLADLLFVPDMSRDFAYFGKIVQKHVDFIVCDANTLEPRVAVELDDSSHAGAKRTRRDAFVERAFRVAGLPLLRYRVSHAYEVGQLRTDMLQHMQRQTPSITTTPIVRGTTSVPPTCPRCGAALVERVARNGAHAGERFWGCSNYPACRYIQPIADTPRVASDEQTEPGNSGS